VIHVAGAVNAPDRAGFHACNVAGTEAMLAAADACGVRRFVHVSSLAAREPGLSNYGWSKAESERVVAASALDWTIVRPPAIYGSGDMEMLDMFRLAAMGLIMLPPRGRLSIIEAGDLGRLLLDLVPSTETAGKTFEPDDGRPEGWDHREFAQLLTQAVGRRALILPLPAQMLRLASRVEGLIRPGRTKLTADRVRYICHPDWVVSPEARPPAELWRPLIETPSGLRATADWYREQLLLRR
jgi:uncharacterized protein YbjT (DUF2867 family)